MSNRIYITFDLSKEEANKLHAYSIENEDKFRQLGIMAVSLNNEISTSLTQQEYIRQFNNSNKSPAKQLATTQQRHVNNNNNIIINCNKRSKQQPQPPPPPPPSQPVTNNRNSMPSPLLINLLNKEQHKENNSERIKMSDEIKEIYKIRDKLLLEEEEEESCKSRGLKRKIIVNNGNNKKSKLINDDTSLLSPSSCSSPSSSSSCSSSSSSLLSYSLKNKNKNHSNETSNSIDKYLNGLAASNIK